MAKLEDDKEIYGAPLETQLVPFPSDRYTVADGSTRTGLRVAISTETNTTRRVTYRELYREVNTFAATLAPAVTPARWRMNIAS